MTLIVTKKSGNSYPPIDGGTYQGICIGVIDIGTQYNTYYQKSMRKVVFVWELPEVRIEVEKDGQTLNLPRVISKTYTTSLHEKSNLGKDLVSWRGRAFTQEEEVGFDAESMLGSNCLVQIINSEKNGKTFANVNSVSMLMTGMKTIKPESELMKYSMDTGVQEPPENIYGWIKDLIKQSEEYKSVENARLNPDLQAAQAEHNVDEKPLPTEDDIPF
ncbi:hypothetical protein LCGC14_1436370 [marine sediment metagenome]|uniref:Phage protein n=1 Tax=marine sediment metagenome TaxID=412755 RepID=A0A0F9MNY2_9ZZZZ